MGKVINQKEGTLEHGDKWQIPFGSNAELPIPREGYYWKYDSDSHFGRIYIFLNRDEVPSLEEENANLRIDVSKKSREIFTLQRDLRQANQDKAAITEAFDKRGEEYNDLREGMRKLDSLIESRKEEHDEVYRENLQLKEDLKKLHQKYDDLYVTNRTNVDALNKAYLVIENPKPEEECAVAEQSVEAKAYEDIHTKRMAAEVESIELDNLKKKNELKFGEDYPHSIWHNLSTRIKDAEGDFKAIALVGGSAGVVLLINEVVQWINLTNR